MAQGICNKCGNRNQLVLADRVCESCSTTLDRVCTDFTAGDWVLIAVGIHSVREHMWPMTSYEQMKRIWAEWPVQFPGRLIRIRRITSNDVALMQADYGPWHNRSDVRFLRPATPEETADHVEVRL